MGGALTRSPPREGARRRRLGALTLALVLAALSGGCEDGGGGGAGWTNPDTFDPTLAATLAGILEDRLRIARAPGATLTVHIPGQGTFVAAAGFRDVARELPMLPRTRFRIGSITKIVNAATLLLLAEEGALSLGDAADAWLPSLSLDPDITLGLLLGHRAGVFNYTDDASFLSLRSEPWTPEEIAAWSLTHDPPYGVDEAYHYSNTGFFLTGLAMEAATGRPFHELVRDHVVDPLGLGDTSEEHGEGRDRHMAEGYVLSAPVTDEMDMAWAWAAGGMVSTGVDLCSLLEATYRGDLLPASAREAMIPPSDASITANGATDGYGLGTRHTLRGGAAVLGHTGSTMGFRGEAFIDPTSGVCVVLLTNSFTATPTEISEPAWQAIRASL